jgi:hypothetical protein
MDNKKFEQLIELIINENEEQARALFHDIVVEKSREIYESMMDEEMDDMEEGSGMHGQVGDLLDEINVEEEGMTEEEADLEVDADDGEEEFDLDAEEGDDDMGGEEDLEDRVVDLEDKLDQLMAEFEEIMGGDEGGEEEFGDEEEGAEDMMEDDTTPEEEGIEEDDAVMEAVSLKQVGGQTYDKFGKMGDNGQNSKSTVAFNSGAKGMASKPVAMGHGAESVPTSPKGPSNAYSKGETQVKGAGSFKNAPAQAGQDLEKAPKPVTSQASGVNTKSVVESKKTVKKIVK